MSPRDIVPGYANVDANVPVWVMADLRFLGGFIADSLRSSGFFVGRDTIW